MPCEVTVPFVHLGSVSCTFHGVALRDGLEFGGRVHACAPSSPRGPPLPAQTVLLGDCASYCTGLWGHEGGGRVPSPSCSPPGSSIVSYTKTLRLQGTKCHHRARDKVPKDLNHGLRFSPDEEAPSPALPSALLLSGESSVLFIWMAPLPAGDG